MPENYQMVRIRNVGDKVFRDAFASTTYEIQPGKDGFVPFDAAALWFGHPDVFDVSPRQRARTEAYRRLRTRYGAFDDLDENRNRISSDVKWEENRPRVEVYGLGGERIITIIDDPEGKHVNPTDPDVAERRGILARLQAVEAESQMLREALAAKQRDEEARDGVEGDGGDGDGGDGEGEDGGDGETKDPFAPDPTTAPPTSSGPPPAPGHIPGIPKPKFLGDDTTPDATPDTPTRPGVQG